MLDTRTITFLVVAVAWLMGGALLFVWWRGRSLRPLLDWAMGSVAIGAGWLLIGLRGAVPDFVSIVVANPLIALGYALLLAGARRFAGAEPPWRLSALFVATVFAGQYYWLLTGAPVERRIVFVLTLLAAAAAAIAWTLARQADTATHRSNRATATVFAVNALLYLATVAVFGDSRETLDSLFAPSLPINAMGLGTALCIAAWSIGFLSMFHERDRKALDELNAALGRRVAERTGELQAAQDERDRAIQASGVVLWETDLRTREIVFGENWPVFLGDPDAPRRVTTVEYARFMHPDDIPGTVRAQIEAIKGLRPEYASEYRIRTASGEWRWVLSRGRVTERDPTTGRVLRTSGSNIDITERRRAEQALQRFNDELEARVAARTAELAASEARLRSSVSLLETTLDATADGIMVLDLQGRVASFNRRFLEMWKIPEALVRDGDNRSLIAHVRDQLVDPDAFEATVRHLGDHLGEIRDDTYFFKDGRVYERHSRPQLRDGAIVGRVSSFRDMTERRRAENQVRAEREFLQTVLDNLPDAVFVGSPEGRVLLASRKFAEMLGRRVEDVAGKYHGELVSDPERLAVILAKNAEALASSGPIPDYELEFPQPGGESRWLLVSKMALRDADGRPRFVLAVAAEITSLKRAESRLTALAAELEADRRLLQTILDTIPQVVSLTDRQHRYIRANRAMAELMGMSVAELIGTVVGQNYANAVGRPEIAAEVARLEDRVLASGKPLVPYEVLRRDAAGAERLYRARKLPIKDAAGHVEMVLTVGEDITELKAIEAQLRAANDSLERRVEARTAELRTALRELETFSYSVSHDLRAPARAVAGFSRILVDDFGPQLPEEAQRLLDRIARAGEAMGAMVDGLLELSRITRAEVVRQKVDLVALVGEIWRDLAALEPERKVELHLPDLLWVDGDPVLLRNLLLNLLGNARKYTRHRPDAKVWLGVTDGGEFFVRDNGAGFDMRYADKLFGAFQRLHTEREFEGHGIGLALARKIVERHGGAIRAESAPGHGATFCFRLR